MFFEKTTTLLLFFVLLLNFSAFAQDGENAMSWWPPGEYMRQALNNTLAKAVVVSHKTEYKFRRGVAFLATHLKTGEQISYEMRLNAGEKYVFIGGGDDDVTDCNLYLKKDGRVYEKDVEDDANPVISFTPLESGIYEIVYELKGDEKEASFVALALMSPDGYDISAEEVDQATNKILTYGSYINDEVGVKIHDGANQWGLFGTLLPSNMRIEISDMKLGDADHYAIAAGADALSDADLQFTEVQSGRVVAEDRKNDPTPGISFTTVAAKTYALNIINVSSTKPAIIITMLLTK